MANSVFLNYRRDDRPGSAGRIFDILSQKLSGTKIFMDVDSLEPGVDFSNALGDQLGACNCFLAVIGPDWLSRSPDGSTRIDDPKDYVRLEIETAMGRDILVVPVLVNGATMPKPDNLPESLRPFASRNAFTVSHDRFQRDINVLADAIKRNLGIKRNDDDVVEPRQPTSSWADALMSFNHNDLSAKVSSAKSSSIATRA